MTVTCATLVFTIHDGYLRSDNAIQTDAGTNTLCGIGKVRWMGESAIVARCKDGRLVVIKGVQDARMIVG